MKTFKITYKTEDGRIEVLEDMGYDSNSVKYSFIEMFTECKFISIKEI